MLANNYNEVLEVYQYPFVNQIENGINSGVSFYNYRGFAGSSGWQKDDADNLVNGYMLPIVSIITCDSPELWQLRLQDPASSTMEGILLFNRHLLFLSTIIVALVGWLVFNTITCFDEFNQEAVSPFFHSMFYSKLVF